MKLQQHEQVFKYFARDLQHEGSREHTHANLMESEEKASLGVNFFEDSQLNSKHVDRILEESVKNEMGKNKMCKKEDEGKKVFFFKLWVEILQTGIAYLLFFLLMFLESINVKAFQLVLPVPLMCTLTPYKTVHSLLMILGLAIVLANYFLKVEILTYPSLFILYLSIYLFNEQHKVSILWVCIVVIVGGFGFFVLPILHEGLAQETKFIFYFAFPLIHFACKNTVGLFHLLIKHPYESLIQLPLFLRGIEFGVILSLQPSSVEFWYMIITSTLQIINERFQFVLRLAVLLFWKDKQRPLSFLTSKCSGHICKNTLHIIILVYCISASQFTTALYSTSLRSLITTWYLPLLTWAFLSVYELFCLLKLRSREDLMIVGWSQQSAGSYLRRVLCLSFGFWLFYLGLCIPHSLLS